LGGDLEVNGFSIITPNENAYHDNGVDSGITISVGDNANDQYSEGYSGGVYISAGNGTTTNGAYGGNIEINAGDSQSYRGGDITLQAGGNLDNATGGAGIILEAGDNSAGDILFKTGSDAGGGSGDFRVNITLPSGNGSGGDIRFNGARGSGTGRGSDVNIKSGDGGSTSGSAGTISLHGGDSPTVLGIGGSIDLTPGKNLDHSNDGSINVHTVDGTVGGGSLHIWNDTNTSHSTGFSVALKAGETLGSDIVLTLPESTGAAGEFLQTDGSGILTWSAVNTWNRTHTFNRFYRDKSFQWNGNSKQYTS